MTYFYRQWGMPNKETFLIKPIGKFVRKYLRKSTVSVDPFAGNIGWATYNNDINPSTLAEYHMDAEDFCKHLLGQGVKADCAIFDPPYSPDQLARSYQGVRLKKDRGGSHNGEMYARVRNALQSLLTEDAVVLSFGWNTAGMGKTRDFEPVEILIVCHGGAHNDTLCLAEKRVSR
jgi:hypothetical protein